MSQCAIDIVEFQIDSSGLVRDKVHPLIIAVYHDREIVPAISLLADKMLVVVTAEHRHDSRLVKDGKEILVSPFLGIPAVPVVYSGNMHYANLDWCGRESGILDDLFEPFQLDLPVFVIDSGSRIFG